MRPLEAFAEEGQQLVGRPEPELPAGIYLLDPSLEVTLPRPCVRSELNNKRLSGHPVSLLRVQVRTCEVSVEFPLNHRVDSLDPREGMQEHQDEDDGRDKNVTRWASPEPSSVRSALNLMIVICCRNCLRALITTR
jgi:hypothetical protein